MSTREELASMPHTAKEIEHAGFPITEYDIREYKPGRGKLVWQPHHCPVPYYTCEYFNDGSTGTIEENLERSRYNIWNLFEKNDAAVLKQKDFIIAQIEEELLEKAGVRIASWFDAGRSL